MSGLSLVLCVVLGQAPAPSPRELVARLGAPRYTDREEASRALERLGRGALADLRQASESRDPEVRTRAAALAVRIEGALLTRPTMLKLDLDGVPLPEAVRSLSEQSGIKLVLTPDNVPVWRNRLVSLRDDAPVPFWKAIDRLCEAGHLQYNYGAHYPAGREPTFPLFDGAGRPAMPVHDSGPFRVSVLGLHYQSDVSFATVPRTNRGVPVHVSSGQTFHTRTEQLYAQLQIAGEPRLSLSMAGTLKLTEAVDDRGQVLAAPAPNDGTITARTATYFGFSTGPVVQAQASMARPPRASASIRTLRGVVPLNVSARRPIPLTIPLASASGRTFQNEEVVISVHQVPGQANNRPTSIELTVRPADGAAPETPFRPDLHQQQIEVADAEGRPVPWYQTGFDAESGRLTMAIPAQDPGLKPAEIRYYGMTHAETEVSFEFHDLPMP